MRIDRFDSASDLRGARRTYEAIKERVLAAGRFSVFEAGEDAPTFERWTETIRSETQRMTRGRYGIQTAQDLLRVIG